MSELVQDNFAREKLVYWQLLLTASRCGEGQSDHRCAGRLSDAEPSTACELAAGIVGWRQARQRGGQGPARLATSVNSLSIRDASRRPTVIYPLTFVPERNELDFAA
jgi:hypothetical protein